MNIVSLNGKEIKLSNNLGCEWIPSINEDGYGIGRFSINGKEFGKDESYILTEDSVNWNFTVPNAEIIENTDEVGKIRFYGQHSKILFSIDVTMKKDSRAIEFDYTLDPQLPVYHRVYAKIPFDSSNVKFVKYPYEDTLTKENMRSFTIETDFARAPIVFGQQKNGAYMGVGYYLDDPFNKGKLGYNNNESCFEVYAQFKGMAKKNDIQLARTCDNLRKINLKEEIEKCKRKLRFIVCLGESQYDCISAYMNSSNYDWNPNYKYSVYDSEKSLMKMYETASYVKGKGYTWRISTDTGEYDTESPHGSYSRVILSAGQLQLATELYNHWIKNRNEVWARERALEMADFFVERQIEQGIVLLFDTDAGDENKAHPEEQIAEALNSYIIMVGEQCIGAKHLLELYLLLLKTEGVDNTKWRDAAFKALGLLLYIMGEDGSLGRNYNFNGSYDKLGSAMAEALLAFQYAYDISKDQRFDDARQKLEDWLWNTKLSINNWSDGSPDSGNWAGAEKLVNNDTLDLLSSMCYCCERYIRTKDIKYINMAKDIFVYQWCAVVPIQMKGFKHNTRSLMREQDFYCCFDPPIRIFDYAECLPFLTKITGDKNFMKFFSIMLQTQMDCQEKEDPFKGFHLGLEADIDGLTPIDKQAEGKVVYIVLFASMFLKTINGPMCYRYVGGSDWGLGLDYYVNFDFNSLKGLPYVISNTAMIRDINYNPKNNTMRIWSYDKKNADVTMEIQWNDSFSLEKSIVYHGEKVSKALDLYNKETNTICVNSINKNAPSKIVQIVLEK